MEVDSANKIRGLLPWIIYLIVFAVLNETVFNVSIPMIAQEFALTPAGVSWVMTIFLVFFGIGSVVYGRLSDIYTLKTLLSVGMVIYVVGSLLGFLLRDSYTAVILFRAIQGMGASALPALIFVIIARYYPPEGRGQVFGLMTSFISISIGIGPVLGGFVSQSLHWSYLFLIPVLVLPAAPFLFKHLPPEVRRPGSVDILGAFFVASVVGLLVLFLNYLGWSYGIGFLIALALLIWRMFNAKDPFIHPLLFKNKAFTGSVVVGFLQFSIMIGTFFLIPLMLTTVHHLETGAIGLILFPGAISGVFVGPIAGRMADKKGNRFVVALGLGGAIVAMATLAISLNISPLVVGACMLFINVGFILFQTALMNSVSQTLPPEETGLGMGFFNLVSIISGAVGTALVGKLLESGGTGIYSLVVGIFAAVTFLGGWYYFRVFPKGSLVTGAPSGGH